jgi:2-iminobutanoate/2-iminopropanoate deaminase
MKKQVISENAPKAVGPYSQAVSSGNLLFVSGQIPLDKNGILVSDKIEDQTAQCLKNVDEILKAEGFEKNNIVKSTIFLLDLNNFSKVNDIYAAFFEGTIYPARSTVEVSKLPKDAKIEIEVIAAK